MPSTPRRVRRSRRSAASAPATDGRIPLDRLPLSDGVVVLRALEPDDAPAIAGACADPEIPRWTFMAEGLTEVDARVWIERAHEAMVRGRAIRFAILDAAEGTFLGQVGIGHLNWEQLVGEIFYWVASSSRRRGVACRATRLVADWAFETLELARIEITVDPRNEASQHVAEAAGFTREGILRSYQVFKGGRMDAVMYSRLPTDP